jgi:hypothetical protein
MPSEHYLTDHEAAEYLGMSVQPCVVSVARGTDQSPSRERPLTVAVSTGERNTLSFY